MYETACPNITHRAEHQKNTGAESCNYTRGGKGLIFFFKIMSFTQTLHHSEF